MAKNYLEVSNIFHNFDEYSPEKIEFELEKLREKGENLHQIGMLEAYLNRYQDEFAVLYRIGKQAATFAQEDNEKMKLDFKEVPYRRPEIEPEEYDVAGKESQLELECTFEDGIQFSLSALKATPKTADELPQMVGQISFPQETLDSLEVLRQKDLERYNEKLNKIFDFCHKYGFSTFGLSLPMRGGEIDVDEKLAELFARYKEQEETMLVGKTPTKISEDENDTTGMEPSDYNILAEDIIVPTIDSAKGADHIDGKSKSQINTLVGFVNNMHNFLRKDLHKRERLSYWEHIRIINGRQTYVFSVYDKENPKNYENDGRKVKDHYEPTYSVRLYVSQDSNGKFYFGYATPGGKPMDATLAADYIGEIKKTGVTHLNFENIPNHDKKTWLNACADKGIVPKGIALTKSKTEEMLKIAALKLSTEEYATFVERLMDQWEENAAKKGTTLAVSDLEYIQKCRNDVIHKREDQYGQIEKTEFENKFKNFRDSYNAPDGLLTKVNKLVTNASADTKNGAATAIAAMSTLARTFDVVLGTADNKKGALDVSLKDRLDELAKNPVVDDKGRPILVRITDEEQRVLAPLYGKQIKDLTKEDYLTIYNLLYKRQLKETKRKIVNIIKGDLASKIHVKEHLLVEQRVWNGPLGEVRSVNETLRKIGSGVDTLILPDKHSGLPVDELKAIAEKELEAEKAAKEAKAAPKAEAEKTTFKPSSERGER